MRVTINFDKVLLFLGVLTLLTCQQSNAACYFSAEFQGEFLMQSTVSGSQPLGSRDGGIQYSVVNITEYAIPIWGQCHKRIGNNVILMVISGNEICARCFHLKLRSRYVLHVYTIGKDSISRCYTDENTAIETCPSERDIKNLNRTNEIILYKKVDPSSEDIKPEYCPIHGSFTFTYDINDGSENKLECAGKTSRLDTCPSGGELNLHFKQCSFENHDLTFSCLGHWEGRDNQNYLALLDKRIKDTPQYRCLIYNEYPNGTINAALSSDSTCKSNFHKSTDGYESLLMTPIPFTHWPVEVIDSKCKFPEWLVGKWEHLTINENTILYKDHSSFETYTIKCLNNPIGNPINEFDIKYLIFQTNQCGQKSYNCIWFKKRNENVLEFQIGRYSTKNESPDLCLKSNFLNDSWIAQASLRKEQQSPCPVTGEYIGIIPDAPIFCAKLSSDCHSKEKMYYEVSDCTEKEIYEERQYRCLGQWKENNLLYTYTQRHDLAPGVYECFVGSIISESEIFIMESGKNCRYNSSVNPLKRGMQLNKTASCYDSNASPRPITPTLQLYNNSYTHPSEQWTSPAPSTNFDNTSVASHLQKLMSQIALLMIFLLRIL